MPNITPPDPGRAMELARTCALDAKLGAFVRARSASGEDEVRYLWPGGGGRAWVATVRPERRVSPESYAILRDGQPSREVPNGIDVEGAHYVLVDDGFEAVAVPA